MKKNTKRPRFDKKGLVEIKEDEILPPHENFPTNPNIPTHHADVVSFLFSNQGLTLARFFSRTPGVNVEECRVCFSASLAKRIVDILSSNYNYYPEKNTKLSEEKKES